MPFSGSAPNQTYGRSDGVRSGAAVNVQARGAGANDTAELADARENDLADAINALWKRDGGNQPTTNLPMNGNRFTGVGAAAARDDFARASQVQDSSLIYGGSAGGTANVITLDCSPSITAYAAGQMFIFKATADNTDDDVTVNVDSVGAKDLRKYDGSSKPAIGEIQNGGMYIIVYDGTSFCLVGGLPANLSLFAALTGAADRLPYFSAADALSLATFTAAGRALIDDADAAAQRTTLGLAIGTDVQAFSAELATLVTLSASASRGDIIYRGASGWARLEAGTTGRRLETRGAGADPVWDDDPTPEVTEFRYVNFDGTDRDDLSGTYVRSGTTVTVTATAHGQIVGSKVDVDATSGAMTDGEFTVTGVADANTFTFTHGSSGATSGNLALRRVTKLASKGVANVAYHGDGLHTVNFSTPMANANYAVAGLGNPADSAGTRGCVQQNVDYDAVATTHCEIVTNLGVNTSQLGAFPFVSVMFLR